MLKLAWGVSVFNPVGGRHAAYADSRRGDVGVGGSGAAIICAGAGGSRSFGCAALRGVGGGGEACAGICAVASQRGAGFFEFTGAVLGAGAADRAADSARADAAGRS